MWKDCSIDHTFHMIINVFIYLFSFTEKQIDWKNVNLKKMRVKELKKILSDWGEKCSGCIEKSDFIKEIEEKKHKHIEL